MMTQSVMTQTANLFGNATGSVTSKGKQNGSGFDLILGKNLKSEPGNAKTADLSVSKKTSVQADNTKKDSVKAADSDKTDVKTTDIKDSSKADDVKTLDQKVNKTTDKTTEETNTVKEPNDQTNETNPDGQIMAQIAGMLQTIRETVMRMLNLNAEQLDQLLSDQGMKTVDLLQPENLQQLVLTNSGETDILATLTNENLADTMKELVQTVENIKTETKSPFTAEQMKEFLQQVDELRKAIHPNEQEEQQTVNPVKQEAVINTAPEQNKNSEMKQMDTTTSTPTATEVKLAKAPENNTDTQADSKQEKHQDTKTADPFQTFIEHMAANVHETKIHFSDEMVQINDIREIASQIIEKIKVSVQPDQTSMELQLNPEHLGKVNLSVQSKNGVMTAQFVVQNEISKEAIESQMHTLRETLNQQGIKVEAIEVTVSANAFEQNNHNSPNENSEGQKERSGKKISLAEAINMTEQPIDDGQVADITGVRGSQVDYTA